MISRHSHAKPVDGDPVPANPASSPALLVAPVTEAPSGPLPVVLSAELDTELHAIVDSVMDRVGGSGRSGVRLLAGLTSPMHSKDDFLEALRLVDTSRDGPTLNALIASWMLGVASFDPAERDRASTELRHTLDRSVSGHVRPWRKRAVQALVCASVWTLTAISVVVMVFNGDEVALNGISMVFPAIFGALFVLTLAGMGANDRNAARRLRFLSAHSLGRLGVPQAVGTLAGAAADGDLGLREMSRASLAALIPRLTGEHYGLLGPDGVTNLTRLLFRRDLRHDLSRADHDRFSRLLLVALEKVGDKRAVPAVAHFLRGYGAQRHALADQARRTLEALDERARQETERATLLRCAGAPAVADGELLRAASAESRTEPEELLRAVGSSLNHD